MSSIPFGKGVVPPTAINPYVLRAAVEGSLGESVSPSSPLLAKTVTPIALRALTSFIVSEDSV